VALAANGTRTVTVVPWDGNPKKKISPPTCIVRSFIPTRPIALELISCSEMPRP
jgi:hypothetical protein